MKREKPFVYIDTNFSLSEILMLKLAFNSSEFELIGISSISSFMNSESAANNILNMAGEDNLIFPIAKGEDENLKGQKILTLGKDINYFDKSSDYLTDIEAYESLYSLARDCGKIDIITTGPLTNIAKAILEYEDFKYYVDHIFMLGSSFNQGDISKNSEFNFFTDPKAVNVILNSDIEVFILPIDLSNTLNLPDDVLNIKTKDRVLKKILSFYKALNKDMREVSRALLLYMLLKPEAFIFEEKKFKVNEDFDRGQIVEDNTKKITYVANRVNEESFYDFLKSKLEEV